MKPLTKKQIKHVKQWIESDSGMECLNKHIAEKKKRSQYEFVPITRINYFAVRRELIPDMKQLVANMKNAGIIEKGERIEFDAVPTVPSAIIEMEGSAVYVDPAYVSIVNRVLEMLKRNGYMGDRNVYIKPK